MLLRQFIFRLTLMKVLFTKLFSTNTEYATANGPVVHTKKKTDMSVITDQSMWK